MIQYQNCTDRRTDGRTDEIDLYIDTERCIHELIQTRNKCRQA